MKTYHNNNERLVTKVFQDVFDKYDLMNDLMSLGAHRIWKKKFIDMIIQDTQLPEYSKVQVFTVFFCLLEKTF